MSPRDLWAKWLHAFRKAGISLVKFMREHSLDPFPLRYALDGYNRKWLGADIKAGTDGALLAVPQGMAFAVIAGLPLTYGITCSAVACIVGSIFASSRHSVFGPTNATSFMIASYFAANPHLPRVEMMPMLVFLVGALLLTGAYCRVADLANYISRTVVIAYLTGAAVQMFVHQLGAVTGVVVPPEEREGTAHTLFGELAATIGHLPLCKWPTIAISAFSLACYLAIRRWRPRWPGLALTLVVSSLAAALVKHFTQPGFMPGIETYSDATFTWRELLPPFPDFTGGRAGARFGQLFGLAVSLAFVAMLENSSMARTLAGRSGQRVDANQDMFSMGAANLACAYLSGMPASNSLTRSMVNYESGARTPVSVIICGLICLGGALTLGPLVAYLPKASLAVVVICVAATLIHPRQIRIAMRATKSDGFVFIVTFAASLLLPLHVAVFTGVGLSVILYLRKASRPSLVEYEFNTEGHLREAEGSRRQHPAISIVHVEGDLFFGAAELFRTQIQRTLTDPDLRVIILRLKNARHLDATSVMALEELIRSLRRSDRALIVSGAMRDVYRVLKDSGMIEVIGRENFFMGSAINPNLSTRNALKRAQEIMGTRDAQIHIYFDPRHQAGTGA